MLLWWKMCLVSRSSRTTEGSVKCYQSAIWIIEFCWICLCSVSLFSASSRIIMLHGFHPQADARHKISPRYYLLFLLSLLSAAYIQFTYRLVSVLNVPSLSGLSRDFFFSANMLGASCRSQTFIVTLQFGAETIYFCYAWKMNAISDMPMATGYCTVCDTHLKLVWTFY